MAECLQVRRFGECRVADEEYLKFRVSCVRHLQPAVLSFQLIYRQVVIPEEVAAELVYEDAPAGVGDWIQQRPGWIMIRSVPVMRLQETIHFVSGSKADQPAGL